MPKNYFNMFPKVEYNLSKTEDNRKIATDILRRVKVKVGLLSEWVLFERYSMRDLETIEDVSNSVYGSPFYHWVLLLLNDVIDPLHDLVKDNLRFDSHLNDKYGSSSHTHLTRLTLWNTAKTLNSDVISEGITTKYKIDQRPIPSSISVGDSVHLSMPYDWYDSTYDAGQLTLATNRLHRLAYAAPQKIVEIGEDPPDVAGPPPSGWIRTDLNSSTFADNSDLLYGYTTRNLDENTDEYEYLGAVTENADVTLFTNLHHYERSHLSPDGQVLGTIEVGPRDEGNPNVSLVEPVSIYEYESAKNESKRNILILRPELLRDFIDEFEALVQTTTE